MNYPDIFFTQEYQELFKDTAFGGDPCYFTFAGIDYRFYKRQIEETPFVDIVSPYGYSGPVAIGENAKSLILPWVAFLKEFHSYCLENNIIAEFARLHPFLSNDAPLGGHYEHEVFYIDLTLSLDEIWVGYDKGCKSAIKKAHHSLTVIETQSSQLLAEFNRLYYQTMTRLGAKAGYIFDCQKFPLGRWVNLVCALDDEKMIAGALILYCGDYAHYFLSASLPNNLGATNMVIDRAIIWAKAQGCKGFNLGGGLKIGDKLESFKRSFTKLSKPFYTYRKIHNQEVYNDLCKVKGIDPKSDGYFPAYRR